MWTLQPLLTTDRPGATLEAMKRFDIAEWKAKREQEGEILLTTEQVAEMRGMTPKAVSRERQSGRGPKYLRYRNTRVRYRLDDVTAFIEQAEGAYEEVDDLISAPAVAVKSHDKEVRNTAPAAVLDAYGHAEGF